MLVAHRVLNFQGPLGFDVAIYAKKCWVRKKLSMNEAAEFVSGRAATPQHPGLNNVNDAYVPSRSVPNADCSWAWTCHTAAFGSYGLSLIFQCSVDPSLLKYTSMTINNIKLHIRSS